MKIIELKDQMIVSDPESPNGEIRIKNVLPGSYRVRTKTINTKFGEQISVFGVLHEDYFKQPKQWNWFPKILSTQSGRVGIFSSQTYQNDNYFENDNSWVTNIKQIILKEKSKWNSYFRGAAIQVGAVDNHFAVYVAKNNDKQIVGLIIDLLVEENTPFSFKEFDFNLTVNEFEF